MNNPLINILTRTSNRPNYFKVCFNSINEQTYLNKRHIISADNIKTEEYVKQYNCDYIRVNVENKTRDINKINDAPYNLYLNDLNNKVEDGWVMYLDDDDCFMDNDSLQKIVNHIEHEDQLLLWRVKFPLVVIPEDIYMYKQPALTHISMIGFMFHSKYINTVKFDNQKCADYRFISQLYNTIKDKVWINEIHTKIQRTNNMGGFGKQDDLKNK